MQDREVRACYWMSKSTVIDEINNNAEYDKLRLPEFLEFLGRIAHAKFSSVKTDWRLVILIGSIVIFLSGHSNIYLSSNILYACLICSYRLIYF